MSSLSIDQIVDALKRGFIIIETPIIYFPPYAVKRWYMLDNGVLFIKNHIDDQFQAINIGIPLEHYFNVMSYTFEIDNKHFIIKEINELIDE